MLGTFGKLGFLPLIAAGASLLAQKKAGDDASDYARAESLATSQRAIASGEAVSAASLMTAADKTFLSKVWPIVRVAAQWSDINWQAIGYPRGPLISSAANSLMAELWPEIRVAAQFSHINWNAHAIPISAAQQIAPSAFPSVSNYLDPVLQSENRKLILAAAIGGGAILLALSLRK